MATMKTVWRGLREQTVERSELEEQASGVVLRGSVEGAAPVCDYELRLTPAWEFVSLVLHREAAGGGSTLRVERRLGEWFVDGVPRPDLADARDVDLSVSPVTNTLPIRRLGLSQGASAAMTMAYIDVSQWAVLTDPQRYTRTGERTYLYESLDSDFRATITVDEAGLVVDYPGLFAREV